MESISKHLHGVYESLGKMCLGSDMISYDIGYSSLHSLATEDALWGSFTLDVSQRTDLELLRSSANSPGLAASFSRSEMPSYLLYRKTGSPGGNACDWPTEDAYAIWFLWLSRSGEDRRIGGEVAILWAGSGKSELRAVEWRS